jgi:hypothetical protein
MKIHSGMKVYKYRCTKDSEILERDIGTFSSNSFFAPKLETFDDKLEANFKEQISIIVDILTESLLIDKQELKHSLRDVTCYKDKIGVYCVTKNYKNEHLWREYANSHQGYCIEYELEKLTDRSKNIDFSNLLEVLYDDKIPTLQIDDIGTNKLVSKMFGVKQEKYFLEEEVRLIFNFASLKKHHDSAITAIYFGCEADESLKKRFYAKFENRDIKFYQMVFIEKHGLQRQLVNEFKRKLKFNLEKYNFEILKHVVNEHVEGYHVYLIDEPNTELLTEFALAFKEKKCHKLCNLHIYNSREIQQLIDIYPLPDDDYVQFADSYIANADFSCDDFLFQFPYKDFKYVKLKNS